MLVVHHPEAALREVVEHHAAHQLIGFEHADTQQTLFEQGQQFRVVIQLVEPVADGLFLGLDQGLQGLDIV